MCFKFFFVLTSFLLFQGTTTALDLIDNFGCNQTKGCFFLPEGCDPAKNCVYALTYTSLGDRVLFEASTKIPADVFNRGGFSRYLAIGFSNDTKIGSDALTFCLYSTFVNQKKAFVNLGFNDGNRVNVLNKNNKANSALKEVEGGISKNHLICRFTQAIEPVVNNDYTINLNQSYHLFVVSDKANQFTQFATPCNRVPYTPSYGKLSALQYICK